MGSPILGKPLSDKVKMDPDKGFCMDPGELENDLAPKMKEVFCQYSCIAVTLNLHIS